MTIDKQMKEMVERIAERELGERPAEIERPAEGLLHKTYALTYEDSEYIIQLRGHYDDRDDSLARGLGCYRLLADSAIPVPTLVTDTVYELDGCQYTIVKQLPGATGKQDISPKRVFNAGQDLARIHNTIEFEQPGTLRFDGIDPIVEPFYEGDWRNQIERWMRENVDILREAGLTTAADTVAQTLDSLYSVVPKGFVPVLCHGDFSPDNVLFCDHEVVGVLDFDRSYVGHDAWDLAASATSFWMHDPGGQWTVRDDFYEGYRTVRSVDKSFEQIEPLYRVATLTRAVSSMIDLGEFSEYERMFYSDALIEAVGRTRSV